MQENNTLLYLKDRLGAKFDLLQIVSEDIGGVINVKARQLHELNFEPVKGIFVAIPVSFSVKIDKSFKGEVLNTSPATEDQIIDAENFIKMLLANKQIKGLREIVSDRTTHEIKVNENNQRIISRVSFGRR